MVANNDGLLKFTENMANKFSSSPVQLQEMMQMAKEQQQAPGGLFGFLDKQDIDSDEAEQSPRENKQ